ncbi:MAG: molecular chaperone DnaK [Tannerella sp.]|jgi:molecular chaperone DnaK|nr:molecular chaperone DnaK [Tannerella sp.]
MGKIIGIDLGTTNSCVAVLEGIEPVVIPNSEGGRTTPSIIGFNNEGERVVGTLAKNQMITVPEKTIFSIKRFMGRRFSEVADEMRLVPYKIVEQGDDVRIGIGGKEYSPQEISAAILQKMKKTAENFLREPVTEAVITVPAYFNNAQRQATKEAGKIAGLDVKRIINEPTAAALAFGFNENKQDIKTIAVYDLGGGTFDVSILKLNDGLFEVKSTNGDTHLGGDDFDRCIQKWLIDEFKIDMGIDLSVDNMALQRLREAAENAKIQLSEIPTTEISLPFITADASGPKHLNKTLTRAKFEQLIDDLLQGTKGPCVTALNDAGLTPEQIDEVILVGGSTRIPAVQQLVNSIFKKEPNRGVNPDEAVAMGAAIQGGILGGDVKGVILLDVTPLSLGVNVKGGIMSVLIPKNTSIPTSISDRYTTVEDGQTRIRFDVLQGDRPMAKDNRILGKFNLDGILPAPSGVPSIEVTFDIDADSILHVSAKDKGTGKETKIRIENSSGLSKSEIDRMIREAELYAEEDKRKKEKAEARNDAEKVIYETEKNIKDLCDKINIATKSIVEEAIANLNKVLESDYVADIKSKTETLRQVLYKIGENIYNNE